MENASFEVSIESTKASVTLFVISVSDDGLFAATVMTEVKGLARFLESFISLAFQRAKRESSKLRASATLFTSFESECALMTIAYD